METLDAAKNPVFKNAEASYFLAFKDKKAVGRIAVIINHLEVEEIRQEKSSIRMAGYD